MENIVQCKRCLSDFNYSPGFCGGARQLCSMCRVLADEEEIESFKEQMIIEGNKYLIGAPKRKAVYDVAEIIVNKNFPEFNSDKERFICANEVGQFVRENGFCSCENNILDFMEHLGLVHMAFFNERIGQELILQLNEFVYRRAGFNG
jgi:hypothetical protein